MYLRVFFFGLIFEKEISILARRLVFQTLAVMSLVTLLGENAHIFQAMYMLMYFEFKSYCKNSNVLAVKALENYLNFSSIKLKQ